MKIMIVDDDVNVRKCLRQLIPWSEIGYTIVAEADDGVVGLQRFCETQPDVIITDLKMPSMDGETFCRKVREISDKVFIIFLSAYESFTTAQLALRCTVTDYILKPINTAKLTQLTDLLRSLSVNYLNTELLQDLVNNRSLCDEITNELRARNGAYFDHFFQSFTRNTNHSFSMVKNTANILIHLLFQVMQEEEQTNPAHRKAWKDQVTAELNSFSRKMDITSFTIGLYEKYLQNHTSEESTFHIQIIEQIKKYIIENIHDSQLGVSTIAEYFDFSGDYLGRIFKRHTDTTLNSYITHIRLNQACRLLKNTQLSIAEIAQAVGYASTNYFCRTFKKMLDVTPGEFRNHF